jgi:hypothetical protein
MKWEVILHHCTNGTQDCHTHFIQEFDGVDQGTFAAPDHDYYCYLEFKLTVTDSEGLFDEDSVLIDPQSVVLTFDSDPSGLLLSFGSENLLAPFQRTVVVGSLNSITAISPQHQGSFYYFNSWSDAGAQSHEITAGSTPTTYIANYHTLLYFDDFEDSDASDWTPNKGSWNVLSGFLSGTYKKKADIISPFTGCSVCTIEANIRIDTPGAQVSLLGWFDDKQNTVEVLFSDTKDKVVLKYRSGGSVITKIKSKITIDSGIDYRVKLAYDGTRFLVYLDNVFLFEANAPQAPNGTVGFRLKSTSGQDATARFAEILVY